MNCKTLYVTDLDGTLLNSQKKISNQTVKVINACIDKGMLFSVATARMPYGCDYRLKDLNMNIPGILTNGVFLYDFAQEKIIDAEKIEKDSAQKVVGEFKKAGLSCFVYTYDEDGISIFYDDPIMENQTQYYSDRALEKCTGVNLVKDLYAAFEEKNVAYITYTGEKELLEPLCKKLDIIKGVSYSFYLNIYNGWYCLEVFSKNASKKNALLKLKKMVDCTELVVFGDNFNDVSMIEIADRSYAPNNALDEVKQMVNEVLPDCDHDGVATQLKKEFDI